MKFDWNSPLPKKCENNNDLCVLCVDDFVLWKNIHTISAIHGNISILLHANINTNTVCTMIRSFHLNGTCIIWKKWGENFKTNLNGRFFCSHERHRIFLHIMILARDNCTTVECQTMASLSQNANLVTDCYSGVIFMSLLWPFFPSVLQINDVYDAAYFFCGVFSTRLSFAPCHHFNRPSIQPPKWHCFIGQRDKWQLSLLITHFYCVCTTSAIHFGHMQTLLLLLSPFVLFSSIDVFLHSLMSHSIYLTFVMYDAFFK